jgi:Ca-activated chloride channel family protein
LAGRILPVGARLTVRHVFQSQEKKPLEVIYAFALPRDAALRRFVVTGPSFSVRSELKPVDEAVKAYEAGLEQGHLAALARQYGDGIINLTLGNLRPGETVTVTLQLLAGVELRDDGLRFRFPFTLAPSYHPRARAVRLPGGMGEMELPEDEFGDVILPQFAPDGRELHQVGFDLSVWMPKELEELASPSHGVRVARQDGRQARVSLAPEKDVPDRDLVLDVRTRQQSGGVLAGLGSDGKGYFAALVASGEFGKVAKQPRRVAFVLDRSGSMQGLPIEQARKALEACLSALDPCDQFAIVAFDDHVETFDRGAIDASEGQREAARGFLRGIDARGGTELANAVAAAADLLGREGGDILVITDGQVMGTERILEEVRGTGLRIHCLGIGSASQDRFLALLARETDGVSRFVTPRERVDIPAVDLFASMGRPVATGISARVEGFAASGIAPDPPAAVFAGSPMLVWGETGGEGEGSLRVAWQSPQGAGERQIPLVVRQNSMGETLRLIRGARLITDLESRLEGVEAPGKARQREGSRVGARIEALSQSLGLASRRMALVAVVERAGDQPGDIPQTRIVPVGMPQDTAFTAYFGAPRGLGSPIFARAAPSSGPAIQTAMSDMLVGTAVWRFARAIGHRPAAPPVPSGPEDLLMDLAGRIQADGGMPGRNEEERIWASLITLLCFQAEGHTMTSGTFRSHAARLAAFLDSRAGDPLVRKAVERVKKGSGVPGEWTTLADPIRHGRPPDVKRARGWLDAGAVL